MILSFLKSARRRGAAARNYRILSALDDDGLRDIGLDRRTLQDFCATDLTRMSAPETRPEAPWPVLLPGPSGRPSAEPPDRAAGTAQIVMQILPTWRLLSWWRNAATISSRG